MDVSPFRPVTNGAAGRSAVSPALAVVPLLAVATIALAVASRRLDGIDRAVMTALSGTVPTALALAVTRAGDTLVRSLVTLAAALLLLRRGRARAGGALLAVFAGGLLLNEALKQVFARVRPDLLPHLDPAGGLSFPSGHSAGAAILYPALALALAPGDRTALAAGIGLALTIGLSRVVLAVHWPSDVVAGWCAGAAWLILWHRRLR